MRDANSLALRERVRVRDKGNGVEMRQTAMGVSAG
jgi:hypothetical protein